MTAVAEVAANAATKAGTAIKKPVFGSKTLYEVDENGEFVPVAKEVTREVPAWMAGVAFVAGGLGLLSLASLASSTAKRLRKRDENGQS